jgi:hypothetical protein
VQREVLVESLSVALVAAIEQPSLDRTMIVALCNFGLPSAIYLFNSRCPKVLGRDCYSLRFA